MTDSYEELTPVAIERKLRGLVTALAQAQAALREARDKEIEAKHAYHSVRRAAFFAAECPKVTRGGYTTAERDAWIEEQAANLEVLFDVAEAARRAAEDHLRVLRDQSLIVMSLGKSVNAAYAIAGSER
jgi:hypothetical protein